MVRAQRIQVFSILAAFTVAASLYYLHKGGDDLASSYFGCKVLAAGEPAHLYSQDTSSFDKVHDPVWQAFEDQAHYKNLGIVHPYVQTPLWAYAIRPLCANESYAWFHGIFVGLEAASFAAFIWVIAAFWTPSLSRPGYIAAAAFVLFASVPVRYAMELAQTHILLLLPVVLAIALARKFPVAAGALLALAAAVKITPAYLLIYWFLARRKKAAVSFIVCSAGLVAITILTSGWGLFVVYLHHLSETSNVLLVSFNNQSFSAWMMGHRFSHREIFSWHSFPLPASLKITCFVLAISSAVTGALLDRRAPDGPPYGAIITLIAATLFAPIAWSHYFFLLLIPEMMLLNAARKRRSIPILAVLSLIILLSTIPSRILDQRMHLLRPQFYAAIICLAALSILAIRRDDIAGQSQFEGDTASVAA